jgi:hypothetical protein
MYNDDKKLEGFNRLPSDNEKDIPELNFYNYELKLKITAFMTPHHRAIFKIVIDDIQENYTDILLEKWQ